MPIATKLTAVRDQVEIGIAGLSTARSGNDWAVHTTINPIASGYSSLVDASDLTGNACGFTVAPSSDAFFTYQSP